MHGIVVVLEQTCWERLAVIACHWALIVVKARTVQSWLHRIGEAKRQGCPFCIACFW